MFDYISGFCVFAKLDGTGLPALAFTCVNRIQVKVPNLFKLYKRLYKIQCIIKNPNLVPEKLPGNMCRRRKQHAMRHTRNNIQLRIDSSISNFKRVRNALISKEVSSRNGNMHWWVVGGYIRL